MVGARLPQRVAALHAPPADQRVLHGEGQRVAHVQAAGDVRRRDHDGERLRVRAGIAGEAPALFPARIQAGFDLGRSEPAFQCHHALPRSARTAQRGRVTDCQKLPPVEAGIAVYQGTARPTTRSISARTRRSTIGGRLRPAIASAAAAVPRARYPRASARRHRPASPGRPPGCAPAADRGRRGGGRLRRKQIRRRDRGLACDRRRRGRYRHGLLLGDRFGRRRVRHGSSGSPRIGGSAFGPRFGDRPVRLRVIRVRRGFGRGHHHRVVQHQHVVLRRGLRGSFHRRGGDSSSFRIRRMEARISSIDGSALSGVGGSEVAAFVIGLCTSAQRPGWLVA